MSPSASAARVDQDFRRQEILSAQVRLLFANANLGVCVNILAATILGRLQWGFVSNSVVVGWWVYMALVSMLRYVFARHFRDASPACREIGKWSAAYAVGAGMAGAGWGGAGILLYPEAYLINQVFLVFVLGGMMLGAASVLAPRPEAFLAFLIPAGLGPAVRLLIQGDETHFAMGALATVFTVAVLITTGRIYRTVNSSVRLQFENRDLVEDLQVAKAETEALNQALELRVQERTAELRNSTEHLQAEIAQREQMEEELLRVRKLESLGVLWTMRRPSERCSRPYSADSATKSRLPGTGLSRDESRRSTRAKENWTASKIRHRGIERRQSGSENCALCKARPALAPSTANDSNFSPHERLISTSRSPPNRKSMKIGRMREGPREAISLMPRKIRSFAIIAR
jgi:hypothetical protein